MKDYSNMSDAEIAMRVACSIDGVDVDDNGIPKFAVDCYLYNSANSIKLLRVGNDEFEFFNPCNNPSDAWPIIIENSITFNYDTAQVHVGSYFSDKAKVSENRKKALRAAMIVYLMMKDEEK